MPPSATAALPIYLTTVEAADLLRLSPRTLEKHRIHGTGPDFKKVCGRVITPTGRGNLPEFNEAFGSLDASARS